MLIASGIQCRERYDVFIKAGTRDLLVVEGFINGKGKSKINLTRTTSLSEKSIVPVTRGVLRIEGEDQSINYLYETSDGVYVTDSIMLNPDVKHRLRIFLDEGSKEYETDFRKIIQTPAIDSISYFYHNETVDFFAHSQNSADHSIFYKWDYAETWEFRSPFRAKLQYKITGEGNNAKYEIEWYDPVNRSYNDSIYVCWKDNQSTGIILGSAALQIDEAIRLPVRTLPRNAWQLSFLYSILVTQFGLQADAYEFYRRMKKNSETLGTIFDAQPSELVGNIRAVTNPSEKVIGFVEFCTVSEKRIFVWGRDLPGTPYDPDCEYWEELDPLFPEYPYENDPEVIIQVYKHRGLIPTVPEYTDPLTREVLTFYAERPRCVDCTMHGSNIKPEFWP